jgi:hypothetical protein
MNTTLPRLPRDLASDLERQYFWWDAVGTQPRSDDRILAQAMDLASFADVRRLETSLGLERPAEAMRGAEPGWISDRLGNFGAGACGLSVRQFRKHRRGDGSMPERFEPTAEIFLATKLKATSDRAEAKDYQNIAAMLSAGLSLEKALGAFAKCTARTLASCCEPSAISRMAICRRFPKPIGTFYARQEIASRQFPMSPIRYGSLAAA